MSESGRTENLGDYKIESEIGRISSGVLYKAVDSASNKIVAIKTLSDNMDDDKSDFIRRKYQHEVDVIATFDHPNILTILGLHDDGGIPYLVMEAIEGKNLKSLLDSGHKFTTQEAVIIIQQILAGLKYIHGRNVLHLDMKPENIYLFDNQNIKLSDFGAAISASAGRPESSEDTLETADYLAPEQLGGLIDPDSRTDLYTAGMILFELLASANSRSGIMPSAKDLRENPVLMKRDELIKHIPEEFIKPVTTAMQANIDNRYQNAAQFSSGILKAYKSFLSQNTSETFSSVRDNLTGKRPAEVIEVEVAEKVDKHKTDSTAQKTETPKRMTLDKIPFDQWDNKTFLRLENVLVQYMGPFAKMLVTQGREKHNTLKQFLISLALRIPNRNEKSLFIRQAAAIFEKAAASYQQKPANTPRTAQVRPIKQVSFKREILHRAQQHLSQFLGPIAKALVVKEARRSENRGDLYRRLANYIPLVHEKEEFLSRAPF